MQSIDSFKVNHTILNSGIYISRVDKIGMETVTTFDIRVAKPNYNEPLSMAGMHTLEHIGATYFRNREEWKDRIVYFGPMGCQTGFYLILAGEYTLYSNRHLAVVKMIMDMFEYCLGYKGKVPGCSKIECGNYKSHNLKEAKAIASNMCVSFYDLGLLDFEYPTGELAEDNKMNERANQYIRNVVDIVNAGAMSKDSLFYMSKAAIDASEIRNIPKVIDVVEVKPTKDVVKKPAKKTKGRRRKKSSSVESYSLFGDEPIVVEIGDTAPLF